MAVAPEAEAVRGPLAKRLIARGVVKQTHPPVARGETVRASSLASFCARLETIRARARLPLVSAEEPEDEIAFSLGAGIHWALQNRVLPELGILRGEWACLGCAIHVGAYSAMRPELAVARPAACPDCGAEEMVFYEPELVHPDLPLRGHPDGLIHLPELREDLGVLEIKSTASPSEVRAAPYLRHIVQLHGYMELTGLRWGLVLYWSKSSRGLDAWIEHVVDMDLDLAISLREELGALQAALDDPSSPLPDRACLDEAEPLAQSCPCVVPCFKEFRC